MPPTKRWEVHTAAPQAFIERLHPLPPLVAQVLYNRQIVDDDAVALHLKRTSLSRHPFQMRDVGRAVTLIRRAITKQVPIVVYGDYDADGITAAAVLVETLRSLGAQVAYYIPSRVEEGYGLNAEAIAALAEEGTRLLITVDCGIRSVAEVRQARQLGMAVVITDHHYAGPQLPPAHAIINPRRPDHTYPFTELAGVGVAYKLAQGLLRANSKVALRTTQRELDEVQLLDLVALGTVADMMPLVDENHVFVAEGLGVINRACRPGVSALLQVVGVRPGTVTARTLGFCLCPRLNAAGRISEATTALDLLLAEDMTHALPLAEELNELNQQRRTLTLKIREQARLLALEQQEALAGAEPPPLLFAASESFLSGVAGLAAGRLTEEFYRPAVIVSVEGDYSKGSARSIPEFHITEALDSMAELFERHGGHSAAAGFTIRTERLPELRARLAALAQEKLADVPLTPILYLDAEVALDALSWELYRELERLEPFGNGNPVPLLLSRRVQVLDARAVGNEGQHLKLYLRDARGATWDAIAFRQGEWSDRLPGRIDLAYELEKNEWNGNVRLQLNVQDIHTPDR